VTLIPVLGIVQVGNQAMADRYTYLPGLVLFIAAGLAAGRLYETASIRRSRQAIAGIGLGAVSIVVVLSSMTLKQIGIWENDIRLWSYVIQQEPRRAPTAYINLGSAFLRQGRFDAAIENFTAAIRINPNYHETYYDRGLAFAAMNQLDRAEDDFSKSIAINPRFDQAYNNRGSVYFLQKRYDKAVEDFDKAIELNSSNAEAYINRAYVRLTTDNRMLALLDLKKGCALGNDIGCNTLRDLAGDSMRDVR
jgi:tetratricopeptide (TPR) repeat protein